jgi:hypothetical protein
MRRKIDRSSQPADRFEGALQIIDANDEFRGWWLVGVRRPRSTFPVTQA